LTTYFNLLKGPTIIDNQSEYQDICKKIYKKVFEHLKSELSKKIEDIAKENSFSKSRSDSNLKNDIPLLNHSEINEIKSLFLNYLNEKDKLFGKTFVNTQLFLNRYEKIRQGMLK
jgi:hypothetical protein